MIQEKRGSGLSLYLVPDARVWSRDSYSSAGLIIEAQAAPLEPDLDHC